ncbi:hypothetical protein H072_466 [Dactylellina haptotyla CBS 200.50]|uniref:Uncharacterized protein n=1 Tax=Dactylellina haptotyla (strain CBS 200.50) TaxID=1284197 RepID=S8CD00_DACHA|nr:hypothetical protein H072_466 [Dactylellina haptotyla CBS 200.50]
MVLPLQQWLSITTIATLTTTGIAVGQGAFAVYSDTNCTVQTLILQDLRVGECVELLPGSQSFKIIKAIECANAFSANFHAYSAPGCTGIGYADYLVGTCYIVISGGALSLRSAAFQCADGQFIHTTLSAADPTSSPSRDISSSKTSSSDSATATSADLSTTQTTSTTFTVEKQLPTGLASSSTSQSQSALSAPSGSTAVPPTGAGGGLSKSDRIALGTSIGFGVAALLVAIIAWRFPVQRSQLLHPRPRSSAV